MNGTKVTRLLPVRLDEDEVARVGRQLADRLHRRTSLDDERKRAAAEFKEKLKGLDAEVSELQDQLRTGQRDEPVDCWEKKTEKGIEVYRTDTDALVEIRAMTDEEKQDDLPMLGDD